MLTAPKGVYLLFLLNTAATELIIGKLGKGFFPQGLYIYVGSAMGSGGLEKRLQRHLSKQKKIFWHIDYLTTISTLITLAHLEILSDKKIECQVNKLLVDLSDSNTIFPMKKFGSSDCSCTSHLTFWDQEPLESLLAKIKNKLANYRVKFTQREKLTTSD